MPRALSELANHLVELRIERVVMEATSTYWKPVLYVLEAHGLDPWLVNARDVKHLPGRPKTDLCSMLCGCARWPNGRCCGLVSCRRGRSGGCGI
jgi:transposase